MWYKVSDRLPKNGEVVETIINDEDGERLAQKLIRKDRLWFLKDLSMYVYYTPTHWRHI